MNLRERAKRTLLGVVSDVQRPPFVPAGHFYSPRSSAADISNAIRRRRRPTNIPINDVEQLALAEQLALVVPRQNRWVNVNTQFGAADASIYRAMLLHYRPTRVVEIGSGYSTAVALDVADESLPELQITCVDPYADRLRSVLTAQDEKRVTLFETAVQDIEPEQLVKDLRPGDFFFIDSTHVVKAGSDVCYLLLHVLPILPVGTIVHVHDIFWPFEYPDDWLIDGRDWTEIYMLQAFLTHNTDWRIVLFGSWLWDLHPQLAAPQTDDQRPGSLWLERVA